MINWVDIPDEGLSNGGLFEVKELEVTENGTYETKGEMCNKVTVNVEGGGGENPNYVQTVTGTLRNPWGNVGDIDIKELSTAITPRIKEATAYIDIDATALNFGHIYSILTNYSLQKIAAQGADIASTVDKSNAFTSEWSNNGVLLSANAFAGGNIMDLLSYADSLPTTLTIVWHSLEATTGK